MHFRSAYVLFPLFFLSSFSLVVADEYRKFTGKDGRTIEALIEGADESAVEIRRADGSRFSVSRDLFSEEDNEFIDRWIVADTISNDRLFKIQARRRDGNESEKEGAGYVTETRDGFYEIQIENRTGMNLQDMEIRYLMRVERIAAGEKEDRKIDIWTSGSEKNFSIEDGEEVNFETEKVELKETRLKDGYYWTGGGPGKSRDKMDGIYLAIIHEDEIVREYALPSGILEDGRERIELDYSKKSGSVDPFVRP